MSWLSTFAIALSQLKTIVELYEKLTTIMHRRIENKKEIFENVVSPLFLELEKFTADYYKILRDAAEVLRKEPGPPLREIAAELERKRADIILTRRKISGLASSLTHGALGLQEKPDELPEPASQEQVLFGRYKRRAIKSGPTKPKTFEAALGEFSSRVNEFFKSAARDIYKHPGSLTSGLIANIKEFIDQSEQSAEADEEGRRRLAYYAEWLVSTLEERWESVVSTYGSLKLLSRR